jgi:hypothetical protein
VLADERELRALAVARIAFGLVFFLRITPLLAPLGVGFAQDNAPLFGWPDGGERIAALGPSWPDGLVAGLCVAYVIAAASFTLGVRARISGPVTAACGWLVLAQDSFGYYHHLHLLFAGCLVLGVSGAGSRFALIPDPIRSPRTGVLLARGFVASIYAWAALGKLRADWIDGRALERFHELGALRGAVADFVTATAPRRVGVSVGVIVLEAALAAGLMWKRTRTVALVAAVVMHLGFEWVGRVDSIGWQMIALLLVFVRWPVRRGAPVADQPAGLQ